MVLAAQRIAREVIAPTRINTWHVLGSSRMGLCHEYLLKHCPLIPWSGVSIFGGYLNTAGHRVTTVEKAAGLAATTSPEIGGVQNWFPSHSYEVVSIGAEPDTHLHGCRIIDTDYHPATFPLLVPRLSMGTVEARWTYLLHAGGVDCSSDPETYLGPRPYIPASDPQGEDWEGPGGAPGPYVPDTTGAGYGCVTASVPQPRHWWLNTKTNWSTNPRRIAFPVGQILAIDWPLLRVLIPGAVVCNHAGNNATLWRWTNTDILADSVFSELLPLKGENPVFVIEALTSDGALDYATIAGQLDAIVARCLTTSADATFIVHTGYPSPTSGVDPEWCQWVERWCESAAVPALYLPTHNMMPYSDRIAAGFYSPTSTPGDAGDTVHAGPLGRRMFAHDIQSLILTAGLGGVHVIHSETHRTRDADGVITDIDAGAGAGKLKIRDGATVVSTITLDDPCGTKTGGVLTFAGFPKTDLACDNAGTPDNAIVTDSDDNVVLTLTAGISGTEVLLAKATYAAGEPLKITSATYEAPV